MDQQGAPVKGKSRQPKAGVTPRPSPSIQPALAGVTPSLANTTGSSGKVYSTSLLRQEFTVL